MNGENKHEWTRLCGELLKEDYRSHVVSCDYCKTDWREVVTITFDDGNEQMINVSGTSQGYILYELAREIYGDGAEGRINRW